MNSPCPAAEMYVTRLPFFTPTGLGSACQGPPLKLPGRLDGGVHVANTPSKHCPIRPYASKGLHPPK